MYHAIRVIVPTCPQFPAASFKLAFCQCACIKRGLVFFPIAHVLLFPISAPDLSEYVCSVFLPVTSGLPDDICSYPVCDSWPVVTTSFLPPSLKARLHFSCHLSKQPIQVLWPHGLQRVRQQFYLWYFLLQVTRKNPSPPPLIRFPFWNVEDMQVTAYYIIARNALLPTRQRPIEKSHVFYHKLVHFFVMWLFAVCFFTDEPCFKNVFHL